jgi:hypothetical protein
MEALLIYFLLAGGRYELISLGSVPMRMENVREDDNVLKTVIKNREVR